jgi:hypothetical protein
MQRFQFITTAQILHSSNVIILYEVMKSACCERPRAGLRWKNRFTCIGKKGSGREA